MFIRSSILISCNK